MNEVKEFGAVKLNGARRSGISGDIACGEHGLGEIGVADMTLRPPLRSSSGETM